MILDFNVPDRKSYPLHITDLKNIDIHTTLDIHSQSDLVASSTGGEINSHLFSPWNPFSSIRNFSKNTQKVSKQDLKDMESLMEEIKNLHEDDPDCCIYIFVVFCLQMKEKYFKDLKKKISPFLTILKKGMNFRTEFCISKIKI